MFIVFLLQLTIASATTTPRTEIINIPGYGPPPTKHYSGFVETDKATGTNLFYYLTESQSDPGTDPLFLW
jgi:serine carboxypeptidase-like clade 1